MKTDARRKRQQGRLRQIAKHVQVEKDLRSELEILRVRRDAQRTQITELWRVLVHEFGLPPGEGHEPACEVAARLLRQYRTASLRPPDWPAELRGDESEMPPAMLETEVT